MGLLPMGADILPPSDDRVFKLLLTDPRAKPGLIKLISVIIGRNVVDVTLYPNEPPLGSMDEKAERLDINCKIDDGSQINLDYSDFRFIPINLLKAYFRRGSKQVYRNNYFSSLAQVC